MKPLDLTTIERIERFIVFEEKVYLSGWIDNSSHGFKVTFGLQGRPSLDSFDKTMKRSKKRGGQRYHCIMYNCSGIGLLDVAPQMEAQFCGRGWSESKGAHLALHFPDLSAQQFWRGQTTNDQEGECFHTDLMLMEIGDDEIIIDQTTLQRVEALKGGAHSKAVAMLLQDPDFIHWLDNKSLYAQGIDYMRTFDQRDELVKKVCAIKSKVEFDHDEQAWERWENQFHRPFIQHMQRQTHAKS